MLAFQGGARYYNGMETEEEMEKSGSSVGIGVVLGLAIVLILKNTSAWTIVKKVVQIGGIVMFAAGVIMLFAGFAQL